MKCSKKRKKGMQVKKYQHGGDWPPGGVDPMERIAQMQQASQYGQLVDYLQRFDQGEIRQMPEGADRGAGVLDMMTNPIGTARAAMEQGRRPTSDEIAIAGRKAGPMADVLAMSYPSMMAYGLKEGMPAAGLIPHSRPFTPNQQGMRVTRSIDQGDDAVKQIGGQGFVAFTPASSRFPTDIYRQGQDAALDYIAQRKQLFKSPEMQRRNAQRIADNLTMVVNEMRPAMQEGNVPREVLDDYQMLEASMVGGKVDPRSALVQQMMIRHNMLTQATHLDVGPLAPLDKTGITRDDIDAIESQANELEKRAADLFKQQDRMVFGSDEFNKAERELEAIDREMAALRRESYAGVSTVQPSNKAGYGQGFLGGQIDVQGKYLLDPRRARIVTGHEFEHGLQEAPYSETFPMLHGSSQFQSQFPMGVPSFDVLEKEMGERLIPRNVPRKRDGRGEPIHRDYQDRIFDADKLYFDEGAGRGRERSTYHAEAKQDLVETGVIPSLDTKVTKQDILRFYNEIYEPEKIRPMGDRPIMDHPQSLRLFEIFDPNVGENAKNIADFMNRLSMVAVGAGGAAAAQEYGKGGKYKIVKNNTWKKMRSVS